MHTAFCGWQIVARGALADVARAVRTFPETGTSDPILVFDDITGRVVDLPPEIEPDVPPEPARPAAAGRRGRPKLGVVPREITLLPRHWDWLAAQPGGASATLRRLVDEARKADGGATEARQAREAAYRFMSAIAGDLPGFEEASRALFADDLAGFVKRIREWPEDVAAYAVRLARGDPSPDQTKAKISPRPPRPAR